MSERMHPALAELRSERRAKWDALQAAGGRGIELANAIDELDRRIARIEAGDPCCRYCGGESFRAWYPVDEGQGIDVWRNEDGSVGFEYNGDTETGELGADTEYWCLNCDRAARTLEYLVGDTDEDEPALRYAWIGWEDGEDACEPPEPGKRWLTITRDGEELAVIVQRKVDGAYDAETAARKEADAEAIVAALNASERG